MKGFNTKDTSPFFRGGKKPNKKKSSGSSARKNSNNQIRIPPVIIDHKPGK